MITVDSTWMDFDIFKLHSSFLSSKSEKNPQWLLKFACKDSEFFLGGGYGGDKCDCGRNLSPAREIGWMREILDF